MKCDWDVAKFLIFSSNGDPLIYYSHLTSIVIFVGLLGFTFLRLKQWPRGPLQLMASSYIVWLFCDLVLWGNEHIEHILFFWTVTNLVEPLIFISAYAYFAQFVDGKPLSKRVLWIIFLLLLPTFIMAPLGLSVLGFDYTNCDRNVVEGIAAYYNYFLEALFLGVILLRTIIIFIRRKYIGHRFRLVLIALGTSLLLTSFLVANFLGTFTGDYVTSQYGHIAVPIFAIFLAYIAIKYESFEPRIMLIDTLVAALVIVLLSLFFVRAPVYQTYADIIAFILVIPLGYTLMTGIRKETAQRKRIELLAQDLQTANDRLKQLDQMKSEFLSVASHQLRAPLTAIKGYISNITENLYGQVPESLNEPLSVIQESTRVMTSSIEDYLNVSRIEQGRMKYDMSSVNVTALAKRATEEMLPVALKKSLSLEFVDSPDVTVNADFGKIKQVFSNLIDNAIKYTEQGKVTVSITKTETAMRFMTQDTGIGIAADEIDGLFAKFTRARDANKVNTTGTGLGLYVAKNLVEGQGGKIWVESDGPGKGSRFIVELPLSK